MRHRPADGKDRDVDRTNSAVQRTLERIRRSGQTAVYTELLAHECIEELHRSPHAPSAALAFDEFLRGSGDPAAVDASHLREWLHAMRSVWERNARSQDEARRAAANDLLQFAEALRGAAVAGGKRGPVSLLEQELEG